ncbi:Non-reducing end alpha-L-arabinofuranosidase BoGH43A [Lachnellula suecica]|uniref:Non-reducing end alpha-L-arabinofuranosidase BoGH43A n=1 Tax=Lachnellula suecica TaxID=602035 RepID=A0A8T9CGJ8_9HELO|nr:Non-reducing end alpha-L-arabinofuranosidase BoGH43A [Lachnellula suecica]
MLLKCLLPFLSLALKVLGHNSTYQNPILPGFHPDPSCIFVPELDDTFFCASSSFLVFPRIPIHASKDLRKWKLVSNVLNRPAQLPGLNTAKRATSGIWAPTLRYRNGTFHLVTTLVYDDYAINATNRFDNFAFTSKDPYSSAAWSDPVHFDFPGYDTSPFWDEDGTVYVTGTHAWQVDPGIKMLPVDLKTGEVGETISIWNGTGASSPEGPHIYRKDGYYYLLIAEGGTGSGHRATIARAKNISGPYESDPANPVLTNSNTTAYFQNVGHADLFQDRNENWWAVALSVRQGPDGSYPMGRETVLTPVTWEEGEWPIFTNVSGHMHGWHLDSAPPVRQGEGSLVDSSVQINFEPGSVFPPEFVHWRFPTNGSYTISTPGHEYALQLKSSSANLTGSDGRSAEPAGQTFIARRQVHSLFKFSVTLDPSSLEMEEQEVGVAVFLDQLHHYDLGIVMLPPGTSNITSRTSNTTALIPYFRVRGITTVPAFVSPTLALTPVPSAWVGDSLNVQITASNLTHYALSAGPASRPYEQKIIGYGNGLGLTWGFTGALLGVYATTNGGAGEFDTYVKNWTYTGHGQIVEIPGAS